MNGQTPVPFDQFENERVARQRAEALLDAKSRELREINQKLVHETEAVRAALANTEAVRQREAVILKEQSILSDALKALAGKSGADAAMQALLDVLKRGFSVSDCFYVREQDATITIAAATRPDYVGQTLAVPAGLTARSRRMGKLVPLVDEHVLPDALQGLASVLIAPLTIPGEISGALILVCKLEGRFTAGDLRILEQVAALVAQALLALREARRNAMLVSLVEGKPLTGAQGVLDAPLEAIHSAFSRLTEMQGQVVGILDALLGASIDDADQAIDAALARMGSLTGSDRVYVFRLRASGDFIDNTHEWCAQGISPMIDELTDIPAEMIDHWRALFDIGEEVRIPDVDNMPDAAPEKEILQLQGIKSLLAVPMVSDGRFGGFVGFDAVRELRSYLPGEVHLIRSVAKVIISVLARRDAETRLAAVHAETVSQRLRLEAILSAMPDLIVELDREGRFVSWHSGAITVPAVIHEAFVNRTPEETLPPELAQAAREKLAELDSGAKTVSHTFRMALLDPTPRWWQLSASSIADQGYLFALRDITEARERTAEIERLSEIARRTTNLVVVTDAHGQIEWVNAAFERLTGWSLDEIRGQVPGHLLQCAQTDQATVQLIRAALDQGQPVQAEILNQTRHGQQYWASLDIQPLHDAAGAIEGFLAVQVDITEQRQQAETLRAAAAQAALARATLETAVEVLQDGFVLFDADDRLVICNSRYRTIFAEAAPAILPGASFESILRYGLERGHHPEAIGREDQWLAERMDRHVLPDLEMERQLADGTWLRVFEKAIPDGGRVELHVDITALKLAEQRALSDRATAMAASRDGISITDAEGRFQYMNRAHLEMFGYNEECEILGQHWSALYAPDEAQWLETNVMANLSTQGGWSGEIMGMARDGQPVDQDVSLTLKDDGGMLCITRDIKLRRNEMAERERLQNELQLAQRREMIGQMAAGLAHDFNNLLAVISGGASLIIGSGDETAPTTLGASRILAASDQAAGLVKKLLTLGARQPARTALDLRRPVQEAAELLRSSLRAPKRLALHMPDGPVAAMADPTDILQVVLNLAINARDAMADRVGTITINLTDADYCAPDEPVQVGRIDPARRYATLSVIDDGPGMPPDVAARILEPYFSTKGDKGTGLGLAVVSSVIADNGGALRLTTAQGQGTRFDVFWPTEASVPKQRAEQVISDMTGRLDGCTILVVDDQQEVLDVIAAYLEAAGAEVAPTSDPQDVVEALEDGAEHWDLLVTDFDMPGMTGAKLAEMAQARAPDLPVIVITALVAEAGRSDAAFTAVLPKPVDRDALVFEAELAIIQAKSRKG